MLGIPGASMEDELRTLALNVACGVDLAAATILQPYPGTAIAQWAEAKGFSTATTTVSAIPTSTNRPLVFPASATRSRDQLATAV